MKSTIGKNIQATIWGGSHEPAIGVDIKGLPIGTVIDMAELAAFMKRRAPGNSPFATKRREPDIPVPTAGVEVLGKQEPGASCNPVGSELGSSCRLRSGGIEALEGAPGCKPSGKQEPESSGRESSSDTDYNVRVVADAVSFEIRNTDTRSGDYKALSSIPRPGHADYTARCRYDSELNMAGGGPFSARMTAPLCIVGGIAMQLLKSRGIQIGAHIYSVRSCFDAPFDPVGVSGQLLEDIKRREFPVIAPEAAGEMQEEILQAAADTDSVGGIVEVCALNVPAGIGGAMYDGIESALAPIYFGIPAVKGVEFGAGFDATRLTGSNNNDEFYFDGDQVKTVTNNHGGILGGISSGMPIIARLAFKPTPSIAREQASVDLETGKNTTLIIKGRHDPCVILRAVPIVEAATALGILDCIMEVENDKEE